jgi:hypothetical protein
MMSLHAPMVRLSIPGNVCIHCGTEIDTALQCRGCKWVDPMTCSKTDYEKRKQSRARSSDG